MDKLFISFMLITFATLIYYFKSLRNLFTAIIKSLKKKHINLKKKRLEDYLDLYDLLKTIKDYHKKKTKLFFYCQQIVSNYYTKLNIFGHDYKLHSNKKIDITIDKQNPLKSDFTEKIFLKSKNGDTKEIIINICYHINNYYDIILDNIEDCLSLEIVFYSKDNKFPKCFKGNSFTFRDYDTDHIPYLKRYNVINISREEFYQIYNKYASNPIKEENKLLLATYNSLFINFIDKNNNNKYEGKIFSQLEDIIFEDFNDTEIKLLKRTKQFIIDNIKNKHYIDDSTNKLIFRSFSALLENIDNKIIKELINKISYNSYFIKYFNAIPKDEIIELIEAGFFLEFIATKSIKGIKKYIEYIEYKNNIFKNEDEFNNFEKLMILMTIYDLVKNSKFKFIRLYDLPISSPFVVSEKIYLDIIKEIKENSRLYFFYLQINSSSEIDYLSLNTWYPIKYIPLIEIKSHILYSRFRFFFIYEEKDNIPALTNPQTLVKSFNVSKDAGYNYSKNILNQKNNNNTAKLLFYKLHENSHSKFSSGLHNITSSRYLYNYDLKTLDIHYNSIIKYKLGREPDKKYKRSDDEGEEEFAIEMFLFGDFKTIDILVESSDDLSKLCNSQLYSGNNFDELHKIISEIKKNEALPLIDIEINKKNNDFYIKSNDDNNSKEKNNIYYFKNCGKEGKY